MKYWIDQEFISKHDQDSSCIHSATPYHLLHAGMLFLAASQLAYPPPFASNLECSETLSPIRMKKLIFECDEQNTLYFLINCRLACANAAVRVSIMKPIHVVIHMRTKTEVGWRMVDV